MTKQTTPMTGAQRVKAFNTRLKERGGCRIPSGYLEPSHAGMLAALLASGYGGTSTAVIARAIQEAHEKMQANEKSLQVSV